MRKTKSFLQAFLFLVVCAAIQGSPLCAAVVSKQPPANQPAYVPGRIIVKYKKNAEKSVSDHYHKKISFKASLGSDSLDKLHQRFKVKGGRRLHAGLDRKIKKGKTNRMAADEIKARFPQRARRAPKGAVTPETSGLFVVDIDSSTDPQNAAREFAKDLNVEYAQPDQIVSVQMVPNDRFYGSSGSWGQAYDDLWGLKKIQTSGAWDVAQGEGVVVAVVDTGVDYNHPDIQGNMWHNPGEIPGNGIDDDQNGFVDDYLGYDFVSFDDGQTDSDPADGYGHGTHVAGTIAATGNNSMGVIGVAFKSKLMAVRGLSDSGSESDLAASIHYAAENGADVINASWNAPGRSFVLEDEVNYAHSLGCVVIAAAGNRDEDAQGSYPANISNVVTVSAVGIHDLKSSFSNWGNKIDVAAPGEDILSLRASGTTLGWVIENDYVTAYGTSMAAPHVSGVAALVVSQHPDYSNEQVRQVIRASADDVDSPGFDIHSGYGRINARKALSLGNALEAKIINPSAGGLVSGPTPIMGTAKGPNYSSYILEYGPGDSPALWTTLQAGFTPCDNSSLGILNPSTLPEGLYTVRLTAFDSLGNAFRDQIQIHHIIVDTSWDIQTAAPDAAPYAISSLALDSQDHPHIVYIGGSWGHSNSSLKYAKWTGSSWESQTIDSRASRSPSLVLDSGDHPHISYQGTNSSGFPEFKYAKWTGASWEIQPIDTHVDFHSIALDSHERPRVSYIKQSDPTDPVHVQLKYAEWTGSSWAVETLVDKDQSLGWFIATTIKLDSEDHPHIVYREHVSSPFTQKLLYTTKTNGVWNTQAVDQGGYIDSYDNKIAFVLDSKNLPYLAYVQKLSSTPGELKYARLKNGAWDIQVIERLGINSFSGSIALDPNGNPHISYLNSFGSVYDDPTFLKIAKWTGSHWAILNIDASGNSGYNSSLAFSKGVPFISYMEIIKPKAGAMNPSSSVKMAAPAGSLPPLPPAPVITSPASATGTVGTAFSYPITATHNPTRFNATGCPAGLSIDTATGLISGTPATAGTSTISLSAVNAGGFGTAQLSLVIYSACDGTRDNQTNVLDVQLGVNQALGVVTPCSLDIDRDGLCTVLDIQRIVNAALGGSCVSP